jgi:hypothetical protein
METQLHIIEEVEGCIGYVLVVRSATNTEVMLTTIEPQQGVTGVVVLSGRMQRCGSRATRLSLVISS